MQDLLNTVQHNQHVYASSYKPDAVAAQASINFNQ